MKALDSLVCFVTLNISQAVSGWVEHSLGMLPVINENCSLSLHLDMRLDKQHYAKHLLVVVSKNEHINMLSWSRSFKVFRRQAQLGASHPRLTSEHLEIHIRELRDLQRQQH